MTDSFRDTENWNNFHPLPSNFSTRFWDHVVSLLNWNSSDMFLCSACWIDSICLAGDVFLYYFIEPVKKIESRIIVFFRKLNSIFLRNYQSLRFTTWDSQLPRSCSLNNIIKSKFRRRVFSCPTLLNWWHCSLLK